MTSFVAYTRVSTARQGQSELGMDAQTAAMASYTASVGGVIAASFSDVESGANDDRAGLRAAIAHAKATKSVVLVAKLDRLSRDLHAITGLQKARVSFVCADMPEASIEMVQMHGVFAEYERRKISERTIAALAQAKLRGVKLGGARNPEGTPQALENARGVAQQRARDHAKMVVPFITRARAAGATSLQQIADALGRLGVATPRGGAWTPTAVKNAIAMDATA